MYNNIIADEMFDTYPQQKELGNLLKTSREADNISICAMSEILKVSPSRLKQIENGDFSVMHEIYTKSLVTRYAKHTNVKIDKLFNQIWHEQGSENNNSNNSIKNAYLNVASLFAKDSAEIDKSGNHMYIFAGGVCAVLLGVFLLKTYTGTGADFIKNASILSADNTQTQSMQKISVLTLDKELKSYKALDTNAKNDYGSNLSKSLVISNKTADNEANSVLKNGIIDASFQPNATTIPLAYIIKADN